MDVVPAVAPDSSDSDTVRAGRAVYLSQLSQDSYYDPWEQSWEAAPARAEEPASQDMGLSHGAPNSSSPHPSGSGVAVSADPWGSEVTEPVAPCVEGTSGTSASAAPTSNIHAAAPGPDTTAAASTTTAASTSGTRAPASDISSIHVSTPSITRSHEGCVIASCTLQLRAAVSQGEEALKRYTRRPRPKRLSPPSWCPGSRSTEESADDPAVASSRDFAEGGSVLSKTLPKKSPSPEVLARMPTPSPPRSPPHRCPEMDSLYAFDESDLLSFEECVEIRKLGLAELSLLARREMALLLSNSCFWPPMAHWVVPIAPGALYRMWRRALMRRLYIVSRDTTIDSEMQGAQEQRIIAMLTYLQTLELALL